MIRVALLAVFLSNPWVIWCFQNDAEEKLPFWYHGAHAEYAQWPGYVGPPWPEWRRELYWAFRNPLQNFRAYVIGVKGREFETVVLYGNPDPEVIQRDDVGEEGWQITQLRFGNGVRLPYWSYTGPVAGRWLVFQCGWQPTTGFFSLKLNWKSEVGVDGGVLRHH